VSSPDPLAGIHVAVNRTSPGADAGTEPLYEHNRLGLAEAFSAYTWGSAYVNHLEHSTGRIETGMYADLVVLDRDPFEGPSDAIADTRVTRTYVQGEQVYAADT
jgi:predicted amidohydrolase YtcJ